MTPFLRVAIALAALMPAAAGASGVLHTELGALTSTWTDVRAHVESGTAITRWQQRFVDDLLDGTWQVRLPASAVITDLVATYGDVRVQGGVTTARNATGSLAVVERQSSGDSDVVSVRVRSPGPAQVTLELQYAHRLPVVDGALRYGTPLAGLATDSLTAAVIVAGHPADELVVDGPTRVVVADSTDAAVVAIRAGGIGRAASDLTVDLPAPAGPTVCSWQPGDDAFGFYGLRLRAGDIPGADTALPRTLSIVTDLRRPDSGDARSVALSRLRALVEALPDSLHVGWAARRLPATDWQSPVPLTDSTRNALRAHLAALHSATADDAAADLQDLVRAAVGDRPRADDGPHLLVVVTDDASNAADDGLHWLPGGTPLRAVFLAVGAAPLTTSRVRQLATILGATVAHADAGQVGAHLDELERRLRSRHIYVGRIDLPDAGATSLSGTRGWALADEPVWQTGRYRTPGSSRVRVRGRSGWRHFDEPLALAAPLPAGADEVQTPGVLLVDRFEDGVVGGWTKAGGTVGQWTEDNGVLQLRGVNEIGRAYRSVPATSYTISVRVRVHDGQGKIILLHANRNEYYRLDLYRGTARIAFLRRLHSVGGAYTHGSWADVTIEVGLQRVRTWINGKLIHAGVDLGDVVPDGRIGLGAYSSDLVEFDDVLVTEGAATGQGLTRGLLPDRPQRLPARLWAEDRATELLRQRAGFGEIAELSEALLDLGLSYGVVTEVSPLVMVLPSARPALPLADAAPDSSGVDGDTATVGNWPNPFNAETTIRVARPTCLDLDRGIWLEVYDVAGQRVRRVPVADDGSMLQARWDGRDDDGRAVASGVYLYRLSRGEMPLGHMLLLR